MDDDGVEWVDMLGNVALQCTSKPGILRTSRSRLQFITFPHYLVHKVGLPWEAGKVGFCVEYRLEDPWKAGKFGLCVEYRGTLGGGQSRFLCGI